MHYDNALDLLAREACQGCPDSQLGRNEEGGWVGNRKEREEGVRRGGAIPRVDNCNGNGIQDCKDSCIHGTKIEMITCST